MGQTMNIYEKIQAVSEKVRSVEKNITIGGGNSSYKAVADIDVLVKVKEAEKEYRIISIPVRQELVKSEVIKTVVQGGYEKITYADIVKMTVRFINLDKTDDYIDVESFGRGLDPGDKGFGKASTYARKYALLNAYKIATGEDPDQTKSEQQLTFTQDEVRAKVLSYLMNHVEYANNILSYYCLGSTDDLDNKQINSIMKNLKAKGIVL